MKTWNYVDGQQPEIEMTLAESLVERARLEDELPESNVERTHLEDELPESNSTMATRITETEVGLTLF